MLYKNFRDHALHHILGLTEMSKFLESNILDPKYIASIPSELMQDFILDEDNLGDF